MMLRLKPALRFLTTLIVAVTALQAAAASETNQSVSWQKVMLEQTLQDRVRSVLSAYIKGSAYISRVDVIASRLKPRRSHVPSERLALGKLDIMAEAPPQELLDSNDVFSYLDRTNITVTLDENILNQQRAEIEKALIAAVAPITQTQVNVQFEVFPKVAPLKTSDTASETVDQGASAPDDGGEGGKHSNWGKYQGLALPTVIFALGALLLWVLMRFLQIYKGIEDKKIANQSVSQKSTSLSSDDSNEKLRARTEAMSPVPLKSQIDRELSAQIHSIVSTYPQKIPTLVRRWLSSDEDQASEALWVLPKLLPMNAMVHLAHQLDENAKRKWRSILEQPLPNWSEASAQTYVSHQLIDDVLRQSLPLADELRELLDGVKTDECAELAAQDVKQGALLISLLSTAQSARVLMLLPSDVRAQVIAACPTIEVEDISPVTANIRQSLSRMRRKQELATIPFTDRAIELIREVGPELEEDIYDSLVSHLKKSDLVKTLTETCPAAVIMTADAKVHRQTLSSLPLAQRADLIFASPSARKEILLGAFGPDEKIRELLDAEIVMVQDDVQRSARAQRDAERTWRSYLNTCRRLIQNDEELQQLIKPTLESWLQSKLNAEEVRHAS